MAQIYNNKLSIAFDIYGCPQHCKHCWIGSYNHSDMFPEEIFTEFNKIKNDHGKHKYWGAEIQYLGIDFLEPHYGNNYKEIYSEMDKLNNNHKFDIENNFDLFSIWRITRDESYVHWLKKRGMKYGQIKIFGINETNDYFYGRKGANIDIIKGTNVLLQNGIIPRWQFYYNKIGLNEINDLIKLIDDMNLHKRANELGGEFVFHAVTFDSDGIGFRNHNYRIEKNEIDIIPQSLLENSERYSGKKSMFTSESEYYEELFDSNELLELPREHWLWFFITSDWNVYPNFMGIAPWWKIGNLKEDEWNKIITNYVCDNCLGLKTFSNMKIQYLIRKYCNRKSNKVYTSKKDLLVYLVNRYFNDQFIA